MVFDEAPQQTRQSDASAARSNAGWRILRLRIIAATFGANKTAWALFEEHVPRSPSPARALAPLPAADRLPRSRMRSQRQDPHSAPQAGADI